MSTISFVDAAEQPEASAPEPNGAGARRRGGYPTPAERAALGRATRAQVPRRLHGPWEPSPDRRDPVALLEEQGRARVQELVPLRYERMLASPFAFFRGGAYLMAADLAGEPRTGLEVRLCDDAHLENFGNFAAPDRRVVISVNDFDETLPGPFEWDVKPLVASFAVAGRDRNFDATERDAINRTVVSAYRSAMHEFAGMRMLDIWYLRLDADTVSERFGADIGSKAHKRFARNLSKAEGKDSMRELAKLTRVEDGRLRLMRDPPLLVPIEDLAPDVRPHRLDQTMRDVLRAYRRTLSGDRRRLLDRYKYEHAACKVVGVGSVGPRAWILLPTGRDGGDPLFLTGQGSPGVGARAVPRQERSRPHGQRVVEAQRLMQSSSDILLGWVRTAGLDGVERDFYVRQLWDRKGSALIESMSPAVMRAYARICGWILARARALGRRDRELSRRGRQLRPGARRLRRGLRRPERAGPRRPRRSRQGRARRGPRDAVAALSRAVRPGR